MSTNNTLKRVASILSAVIILVIIGFAVREVILLTNGGTDEFKTFYVSYGKRIFATSDSFSAPYGQIQFDVNYPFDINSDGKSYDVKIIPDSDSAFEFQVDGQTMTFGDEELDLSSAFCLEKHQEKFTIKMPFEMQDILNGLYANQTVTIPEEVNLVDKSYFVMIVTSYNGKSTTRIKLMRAISHLNGVQLPDNIYFTGA